MAQLTSIASRVIGYKTLGDWSVSDLHGLLQANATIYGAFESINSFADRTRLGIAYYRSILEIIEPGLAQSKAGSEYLKLYRSWLDLVESESDTSHEDIPPHIVAPPPLSSISFTGVGLGEPIGYTFRSFQSFSSMRIYRIHMASPGGVSLTGVADVMREVREFIKDVWYRNKHEKTIGQLEIINKFVDLRLKVDTLPKSVRSELADLPLLCRALDDSVHQIRQLESRKLLDDVPNNLDHITER